jgi:hypothetical protein
MPVPNLLGRHSADLKGQLVNCRADLWNLRTTCKLKLPHLTEGGTDQAAIAEQQKKKKKKHYPTTWQDYNRASI